EPVRLRARLGADADLVEGARTAVAQQRGEDARVVAVEDAAQARQRPRIGGERVVPGEAGGKLHAPGLDRTERDALLELLHEHVGGALDERDHLAAAGRPARLGRAARPARRRPFLDAATG